RVGGQDLSRYGCAAAAGDFNGDGYSDVVVGASTFGSEGIVRIFPGSATGPSTTPAQTLQSNVTTANFGASVASAGDVNGDGFPDLLVGAPFLTDAVNYEGAAFLYYGNEGDGLERSPRQMRVVSPSVPIPTLPGPDSETSFRLRALARTPAGRGRVALQWEVKPLAVPLDGTGLQKTSSTDTGTPGPAGSAVPLAATASGLS